jgi:hypothetical protein
METSVELECVELLLNSITPSMGIDGLRSSFMFGEPGSERSERRFGTTLYYHPIELTLACLHLRKNGPTYLRSLAIDRISDLLRKFIVENYWHLFDETWAKPFDGTYAEHVSRSTKETLARELATSSIFTPSFELTLYPLATISVKSEFRSELFSLFSPQQLVRSEILDSFEWAAKTDSFPPLEHWNGRREEGVVSWLAIRSPVLEASDKIRSAILGAIALTTRPNYTYLYSGRRVNGGRCTIGEDLSATVSFGEAHTPPIMHNIDLTDADHEWLTILSDKLMASTKEARRELRALEYYYRAWALNKPERFPVHCMAIDAVFGDANGATQAVIEGIQTALGSHLAGSRLRGLMKLRAAVIHGGAPDVYESSKYAAYYSEHGVDPIYDLEILTAACLRAKVFNNSLRHHADPNADLIRKRQEAGRLPGRVERVSILDMAEENSTVEGN